MSDDDNRVIAHVDLDCFYVQVERSLNPFLKEKPVGVVQYNPFGELKSYKPSDNRVNICYGSLIAVSYEARAHGVKRNMRGKEASGLCKDLLLVQVPTSHGKADLTIYRDASNKIVNELKCNSNIILEKASIDEVYIDLTTESNRTLSALTDDEFNNILENLSKNVYIAGEDANEVKLTKRDISVGHNISGNNSFSTNPWFTRPKNLWSIHDKLIIIGCHIIQEYRKSIFNKLGYTCSSGISNNKMLAKVASGMHKPNKLTIIPKSFISSLMTSLPISRIPGYNGKLGSEIMSKLPDVQSLGEIHEKYTKEKLFNLLQDHNNNSSNNLHQVVDRIWNTSYGNDTEAVIPRTLSKSIGCGKSFRAQNMLTNKDLMNNKIYHWVKELSTELFERCDIDKEENVRQPEQLTVGISVIVPNNNNMTLSRIFTYPKSIDSMITISYQTIKKLLDTTPSIIESKNNWNITYISMSASSFVPIALGEKSISSFFKVITKSPNKESIMNTCNDACELKKDISPSNNSNDFRDVTENLNYFEDNNINNDNNQSELYNNNGNFIDSPFENKNNSISKFYDDNGNFFDSPSVNSIPNGNDIPNGNECRSIIESNSIDTNVNKISSYLIDTMTSPKSTNNKSLNGNKKISKFLKNYDSNDEKEVKRYKNDNEIISETNNNIDYVDGNNNKFSNNIETKDRIIDGTSTVTADKSTCNHNNLNNSITIEDSENDSDIEILDTNALSTLSNQRSLTRKSNKLIPTTINDIDQNVFNSLPKDIKNEILQSIEESVHKQNVPINNRNSFNKNKKLKKNTNNINTADIRQMFRK